jgi:CheY-like chemotaxis protein
VTDIVTAQEQSKNITATVPLAFTGTLANEEFSMSSTVLLSVGLDSMLLEARNAVLRSEGYLVKPASSLKEAVQCFREGDFQLVVLCHSLPKAEREQLICWIRASGSSIPIVTVSAGFDGEDQFANAIVKRDPASLLKGIRRALRKGLEYSTAA